jgi:hypothetical protein
MSGASYLPFESRGTISPSLLAEVTGATANGATEIALPENVLPLHAGPEPFVGLSHAEVLDLQFEDEPDLVDGIVECGVVGAIAGIPETYKSWVAQAITVGVAAGTGEVLGRSIRRQGPVGYVWQDDSRRNEAERVQTYARVHDTPRDLPITWFLNVGLVLPDDIARLRATVEQRGLVLLVIDSFYNVADCDMKDREAGAIVARLKREVTDPTGCTVLIVDHMPWATDSNRSRLRAYGDVFKGAAARFGIYIDANGSKLHIEARGNNIRGLKKTPAYWDVDRLELRLVDAATQKQDEDELDDAVLAWVTEHPGQATTKVAEGVGKRRENVAKSLERLGQVEKVENKTSAQLGTGGMGKYWFPLNDAGSDPSLFGGTPQDGSGSGSL